MPKKRLQLPIPPAVESSKKAMEIIRVWIVDGHQEIVLSSNLWNDPGAWGLLLVDIARHVSIIYQSQSMDKNRVLKLIRAAFEAEWENPTE